LDQVELLAGRLGVALGLRSAQAAERELQEWAAEWNGPQLSSGQVEEKNGLQVEAATSARSVRLGRTAAALLALLWRPNGPHLRGTFARKQTRESRPQTVSFGSRVDFLRANSAQRAVQLPRNAALVCLKLAKVGQSL